jgi:hypothetical protein
MTYIQERARGPKYDTLIDELIDALRERYGHSLLVHWEDFSSRNSYRLLASARDRVSIFCPRIVASLLPDVYRQVDDTCMSVVYKFLVPRYLMS